MTEKIYGVTGLMEWDALIVCGKARLRVRFEGGSSSGFGEAPALYRTTNPAAQHIIENSSYFKEKRIRLLRVIRYADTPQGADNPEAGEKEKTDPKEVRQTLILEEKEFPDAGLARRFLHEECGVPTEKLRTSASIKAQGELYGYKMIFRV